jgi:hypothetical protein
MRNLETDITINAPAEKVWSILTDFDKYPEWNPFVVKIKGKPEVNAKLRVTMKNGKGVAVFEPNVTVAEKNRAFEWLGSLSIPGMFSGNHYFRIQPTAPGQVKFIHGENFTGILVGLLFVFIGEQTKQGFINMNQALKERAEKN